MYQNREDLDILFRRTPPETILKKIRSGRNLTGDKLVYGVDAGHYSYEAYNHYSLLNLPEYSPTELEMRSEALDDSVGEIKAGGIFLTLVQYAEQVLHYDGESLTCQLGQTLNWQSIYLRLGQDIFTTAWLAWKYRNDSPDKMKGHKFTWPTVLKTDDKRLNAIMKKGLAENHFHLHGSTQSFPLSWACMMNHPAKIRSLLGKGKRFRKNLGYHVAGGMDDNEMDMEQRILYAAMIRALLFERFFGLLGSWEEFEKFEEFPLAADVEGHTGMLRYAYGVKFVQVNGKKACLDYANCMQLYQVDEQENNRLLAGERAFLYQCFRMEFRGELTNFESNLFYLYLLIKSNFRGELVQNNNRFGFQNFLDYQDRKNQLFECFAEYWTESLRLSVCSSIKENHLISLEARIMPQKTKREITHSIAGLDKRVEFSAGRGNRWEGREQPETKEEGWESCLRPKRGEQRLYNWQQLEGRGTMEGYWEQREATLPEASYYYAIHFAKEPFHKKEFKDEYLSLRPRNSKVRSLVKQQAKAVARYMHGCDGGNQRVWGIDAAAMEIGCRPEVFATEIRYLRDCSRDKMDLKWYREAHPHKGIGITYHVGEDFLDIADGLRAIDEAIQFLCLEKGERIGHGLVLGAAPEEYYQTKNYNIYLRKQDYLDNLVWLLYRSVECEVAMEGSSRACMEEQAMELLHELYPQMKGLAYRGNPLDLYYRSWHLRGDHPDLYQSGVYDEKLSLKEEKYDFLKIPGGRVKYNASRDKLEKYRRDDDISKIYYWYHFDKEVKERGYQVLGVKIEQWYISIVESMQKAMQKEVFRKGICIECNPTSNVLIGTFKRFIKHPILRFNSHHLGTDEQNLNIPVSINTDDLGVFDTSLENEYAVMQNAICRERHEKGNYNDDAIYEYLEYLRQSGINMAFYGRN